MSPARTALVDWLRQCSDDELAGLLAARPDLLHPVPSDVAVLANRATGRASVEIALDRLDVATLHVVEAFALVPEPTDEVAIAASLGVTVGSVTTPIARLRQAMLVWGADDALWLAAVVRDLMPTPANLGPPVRVLLEQLPAGQLARLVVDLGLDLVETGHGADGAAAAAISAVAGVLEDPQQVTALLDRMPPGAREVVELLAQGPPTGRVPAARRTVTAATADSPVRWLLAHGLLIAVDDYSVVLPREVALVVRGGHAFHDITLDPPTPVSTRYEQADVDAAAAGQAFSVVRLIESLLERWGVEPPAMLRSGGLGVRELRRTARELDVDETTAALLIEVAHAAGLVAADAETGDSWVPTMAYDVWLAKSSADRWAMVAAAWLTTTRVVGLIGRREPTLLLGVGALGAGGVAGVGAVDRASAANALGPDVDRALAPVVRRDLLRLLVDSAEGVALTLDSLGAILRWSSPRRGGRLRDDLVGWSHAEGEFLGITGRGAVSSFGRRLCELVLGDVTEGPAQSVGDPVDPVVAAAAVLDPLLPRPLDHVLLQADMTAVAPGPLESDLARELAMAADVESTGGATVFRFSAASVRRALDAGRSAADLHTMLATRSRTPVPQPLSYLIDDVARRHGRVRIGVAGAYLRCDDEAVLSEVLADRRAESLRLRRLSPTVVVSPLAPERVAERLRELGYAPAAETPDGALLLRRPDARRAPSRPRAPRRRPELAAPAASVIGLAVKAIRGGDRAVTAARGAVLGTSASDVVPHSASSETLAVLQDAVVSGRAVWIGYLNAQGQASNRIIEPQRLAGGYLTAYDYRRDEPRTFAVHRITGVAELDESDEESPAGRLAE